MTDKKQSAVARRLSQKLSTLSTETSIIGDQNLNNAISDLETQSNYLTSELPTIKDNASYAQANVSFHSDPTNLGGWEARILDLENNPSGGGGIDPTDPTQPILIWDNFIQQSNGDESGTVLPYSFAGPPRPTSSKTLTPTGLIIYEANSETDHIGIVQVTLEQPLSSGGSGYLNLVNAPTLDSFVFDDLNTIYFIIKTENPTDSYKIKLGLFADIANPTQGIYFEGTSGANWVPTTDDGTASTGTTTALASSTWYTLKIQKKSATSVGFTVNTGTEVVLSTNIPTSFLTCGVYFENTTGSPSEDISFKLDFFSLKLGDVTPVLPTGTTVEGTPNEVEVTTVGSVVTVGLPSSVIVDQVTVDQLNLDTTLTPADPLADGVIAYDPDYQSPIMGLDGGATNTNINAPLGSALVKLVRNSTGATITKGQVVYITGSHASTHLTVALADASSEATARDTIGVAAHDIANNSQGWIITQGYLKGFATNTTPGTGGEGDTLWLSTTAGAFTYDRPLAPDHAVVVGFMVKSAGAGAGSIYVKVSNGQELEELHDVRITSIANNDVLQWDNTDLRWENRSLATAGIAAASHTHTLSNITQSSAGLNQVPQWNGSNWVPVTLSVGGGTPGGSTDQVQYNNASAFAGATNVKINSNNLELVKPATEPTTAPADSIVMYTKSIGQRDLPAFVDSSGWATNLQTCIARNKFSMMNFNAGTATAPTSTGFIYTATSVGTGNTTAGTVSLTTTSLLGGSRRSSFLTANTSGNAAGWRTSVAQCWRGNGVGRGGFFCVWKFGIGDATLQNQATLFVGLNDSTGVPDATAIDNPITTVNNSMRNTVGLVLAGGSTTYTIVYRNGTAAASTIALTGFTANLTDIVEFCLYATPNDTTIHYYVKIYANSGSNLETSGNIGTSNIPANTIQFVPHCWRGRSSVAGAAVAVHCHSFSVEQPH
jgi:hypothetical protein